MNVVARLLQCTEDRKAVKFIAVIVEFVGVEPPTDKCYCFLLFVLSLKKIGADTLLTCIRPELTLPIVRKRGSKPTCF